MRLSFHGACHIVTGSCFMLEGKHSRILIDCGMFQGSKTEKELNYRDFPFDPTRIDALVLTHAHIDHSGLVPKLVKAGFTGKIFTTRATADLCSVMLPDSGHIQEMEVEQLNRRNRRRGHGAVLPIYTSQDAVDCLERFEPLAYGEWRSITPDFRARFWNAGHLLGSASVEIEGAGEDGRKLTTLFSGDVGPNAKLLESDPTGPTDIDHLICESTYGDTQRQVMSVAERRATLLREVEGAANRKGALLIPSFAVERTQELLADLVALIDAGSLPRCPIFIDSPLATKASAVFGAHADDLADGAALVHALHHELVHFTETPEQSKAIGRLRGFHIILSASGMCEAGRIRHHLNNWLWRSEGTVLLVGFQAQGTLGRILLDGATQVRIMGEQVRVAAQIRQLDLYSGHADGPALVDWIRRRLPIRGQIFLVHGEQRGVDGLIQRLADAMPDQRVTAPTLEQVYALEPGQVRLLEGPPPRLPPEGLGHFDWHNDMSQLVLDIDAAIERQADEKGRAKLIRRLRRALDEA